MRSLLFRAGVLACTVPMPHRDVAGQTVIRDVPGCPACSIRFQQLARLGDAEGEGALVSLSARIRVDGSGRYWVAPYGAAGLPQVFATNGRFLATVGRRGGGPGEFMGGVNLFPASKDSMLVYEPAEMRATLFGADLKAGRTIRLPGRIGLAVVRRWPDAVFAVGLIQTTERFGWPLHLVSFAQATAEVLRSGGGNEGQIRPNQMTSGTYAAQSESGALWTSEYVDSGYRLIQWDSTFKALDVIERRPAAWRRRSNGTIGSRTVPPDDAILSIALDAEGLLWIFRRVPAKEWRSAWPNLTPGTPGTANGPEMDKLFASIVEVVDPVAKRLIALAEYDSQLIGLPMRRAASFSSLPDGTPIIDILQMSLAGQR